MPPAFEICALTQGGPLNPHDLSGVTKSGRRNRSDDFKSSHTNVENWGFANPRTGKPYWPGRVQENWLIPAATKVGIGRIGWHTSTDEL
jgi:hypothetical protein